MGFRDIMGLCKTYHVIGYPGIHNGRFSFCDRSIQIEDGWFNKYFIQYIDSYSESHINEIINKNIVYGKVERNQKLKLYEIPLAGFNNDTRSCKLIQTIKLKPGDVVKVYRAYYIFRMLDKPLEDMRASKQRQLYLKRQQEEINRKSEVIIRNSHMQEDFRNFVRGETSTLSGDVFLTSPYHQITESIDYARSFFQRCFDTELRNNKHTQVEIYNSKIGSSEIVTYNHLAFMKGDHLSTIREVISERLESQWQHLLSYIYADEFKKSNVQIFDFQNEIFGERTVINPNVRVIQFDDSLSDVYRTFIHKLFSEK